MCGRFSATFNFRQINVRWNLQGDFSFEPRYNIAPSQSEPVIVKGEKGYEAKLMKWRLVPSWSPDPSLSNRMINARAETLMQKPSFRQLIGRQHCVIPADGFYEWRREGSRKVPVWVHVKQKRPFVFAGLWDSWRDPALGDVRHTFTIITTEANALLRRIHPRMPVIYNVTMGRQWLEWGLFAEMALALVLRPCRSEYMAVYDVSTLVNAPENDNAECIKPLPRGHIPSGQLPLVK
jgi:putative SOS response-associated peptidase YedK